MRLIPCPMCKRDWDGIGNACSLCITHAIHDNEIASTQRELLDRTNVPFNEWHKVSYYFKKYANYKAIIHNFEIVKCDENNTPDTTIAEQTL